MLRRLGEVDIEAAGGCHLYGVVVDVHFDRSKRRIGDDDHQFGCKCKKTKLYFQVFLKVLLSPVLICTGHIHHIFEVATNSLPMVPSKHLFVFCQNSALTQLTFSNFHLYTILLYHRVQRGYYYKTFNERGSRN